jgi:hypothetical protein
MRPPQKAAATQANQRFSGDEVAGVAAGVDGDGAWASAAEERCARRLHRWGRSPIAEQRRGPNDPVLRRVGSYTGRWSPVERSYRSPQMPLQPLRAAAEIHQTKTKLSSDCHAKEKGCQSQLRQCEKFFLGTVEKRRECCEVCRYRCWSPSGLRASQNSEHSKKRRPLHKARCDLDLCPR